VLLTFICAQSPTMIGMMIKKIIGDMMSDFYFLEH
jgi:hypothetical protein